MYVPVKGGEQAIAASRIAVERSRRGDDTIPEIEINQIMAQMSLALDRIMSEGAYTIDVLLLLPLSKLRETLPKRYFSYVLIARN